MSRSIERDDRMEIIDNSEVVKSAMESVAEKVLTAWSIQGAFNCADELEMTPRRVDTGRLKSSVHGKVQGKSAVISTNVEYAIYVHEGTRYMIPNRFMRNGIERHKDEYIKLLEHILQSTNL